MEIILNGKTENVNGSLQEIVGRIVGDKTKGVAVAVNNEVVSKNNWDSFPLKENDKVLIIKASQGG